jgi:hypothetical protein
VNHYLNEKGKKNKCSVTIPCKIHHPSYKFFLEELEEEEEEVAVGGVEDHIS